MHRWEWELSEIPDNISEIMSEVQNLSSIINKLWETSLIFPTFVADCFEAGHLFLHSRRLQPSFLEESAKTANVKLQR